MRKYTLPYLADWFTTALRWFGILGLVLTLPSSAPFYLTLIIILWALVNLGFSIFAGLNRRLGHHRHIAIFIDSLLAALFFFLQGGPFAPAWWVSLLPLIASGIYFELRGSLLVALLLGGLQSAGWYALHPGRSALVLGGIILAFNLVMGIAFGILGRNLFNELRRLYQKRVQAEKEQRKIENERLRAIYALSATLTSTLSYQRVLDSILDMTATALEPAQQQELLNEMISVVLLFSKGQLIVASARRLSLADRRVTLEGQTGLLAQVLETGNPLAVHRFSHDPELSRMAILQSCRSLYLFPLRSGFDIFGVLLYAHPQPGFFTPERQELLEILGRQAVIAIKNAKLYEELLAEKEHLAEVQEEARNKLARDLHDGPTQTVSAIAMRLNYLRLLVTKKPEALPEELEKLEEMARRATKELRHMLFTLRPLVLETQGLQAALESMADKMRETYGQNVLVQVEPHLEEILDVGKRGVLFFIAEEAVNNARKHAQAEHIWVTLRDLGREIALLEIKDDGQGFDVQSVMGAYETRGSLGMVNLRERTELVNGLLHIDSAPGKGTTVQVFIPLSEEAADRLHHARDN